MLAFNLFESNNQHVNSYSQYLKRNQSNFVHRKSWPYSASSIDLFQHAAIQLPTSDTLRSLVANPFGQHTITHTRHNINYALVTPMCVRNKLDSANRPGPLCRPWIPVACQLPHAIERAAPPVWRLVATRSDANARVEGCRGLMLEPTMCHLSPLTAGGIAVARQSRNLAGRAVPMSAVHGCHSPLPIYKLHIITNKYKSSYECLQCFCCCCCRFSSVHFGPYLIFKTFNLIWKINAWRKFDSFIWITMVVNCCRKMFESFAWIFERFVKFLQNICVCIW